MYELPDGNQARCGMSGPGTSDHAIVFLNASFFSFRQWDLLAARVAKRANQLGIDPVDMLFMNYRGFDGVQALDGPMAFDQLVSDALEIIAASGLGGELHLVGASLGSIVGQTLLGSHNLQARSLVTYGHIIPSTPLIAHVQEIFSKFKSILDEEDYFTEHTGDLLRPEIIGPVSRAMWEVFVMDYSKTPEKVKAKGEPPGYEQFLLKYIGNTAVATLGAFLGMVLNDLHGSPSKTPNEFSHDDKRVVAFQGEDDLIAPLSFLNDPDSASDSFEIVPVPGRGHTDFIIDEAICDAMAVRLLCRDDI